jgi:tellurite resistance protein TerC
VKDWGVNTYRMARKIVVLVIGGTVTLVGIALIVLPGPAFIVIPAGLAILAIEFAWARRWLQKAKDMAKAAADKAKSMATGSRADPGPRA